MKQCCRSICADPFSADLTCSYGNVIVDSSFLWQLLILRPHLLDFIFKIVKCICN